MIDSPRHMLFSDTSHTGSHFSERQLLQRTSKNNKCSLVEVRQMSCKDRDPGAPHMTDIWSKSSRVTILLLLSYSEVESTDIALLLDGWSFDSCRIVFKYRLQLCKLAISVLVSDTRQQYGMTATG